MNAVFYHARISGGHNVDTGKSIDPVFGRKLFLEQMSAVVNSGLWENVNAFYIGLNGGHDDFKFVEDNMPVGCQLIGHGEQAESLLPTTKFMHQWAKEHPQGWKTFFFHTKGATHPHDPNVLRWRRSMDQFVIWRWKNCVADLESGNFDAVGSDWRHNSPTDPNAGRWGENSYFAGAFWWATSKYIASLPELPEKIIDRHSWYQAAELWIGHNKPRIKDYAKP